MSTFEFKRRPSLSAAQRREMTAVAAYYLAEARGFAPGGEEGDWLAAERLIDAMLAGTETTRFSAQGAALERIRNALSLSAAEGVGPETA